MSFSSFQDLRSFLENLPEASEEHSRKARERNDTLTKPAGSLGRLEELAIWAASWQKQHIPTADNPQVIIFAGNHGVCKKGVSAFPSEVTSQMVANFKNGGAAINQLAKLYGASFAVHPLDLDTPTEDFTEAAAMDKEECLKLLNLGWAAVDETADCLVIGEMGIGNTTVAAAICAALYEMSGNDWAGPGTGLDKPGVTHKAAIIDQGLSRHKDIIKDPLEVLRCLGGREFAAMAGAILRARQEGIPVLLDGFVVCAAAAVLHAIRENALDHCVAGHCSAEPGHKILLDKLGHEPLLELGMRLGEGSGAALSLGILKGAFATHGHMASFAEAGVSGKD
ncbi:nicotinate-nucleotide--dimethylbenzimidazole phosphoribosyltransferase [Sneathiella limimaris]|uniref:nicotinate-nucleotide--dimethylbenzimidazole phosphoribosyltransferase n=1 Tax=Sneathiella limimaris TaxID=1964213 RepID=UPI00146D4C28|nr:nicotinate-nucleotide--dimethylbenzimidazole phosphoribosyltransferase [Sneathiella limimaris]